MNRLDVYLHHDLVGHLDRLEHSLLTFSYTPEWVEAGGSRLSASLPVRSEPFDDREARPYFAGLLPEGRFLRDIARVYAVSASNAFSMLEAIGGECAGAITMVPAGEPLPRDDQPRWMEAEEFRALIAGVAARPLALIEEADGLRLSLAGAQEKLPVIFREESIGITRGFPPSTHIMKIPDPRFPGLVANEAYCMILAGMAGLDAALAVPVAVDPKNHRAGEGEVLVVVRFDREQDTEISHRLHQEDFCQAMGVVSEEKYEADGGPGLAECAGLLRGQSSLPARDLIALVGAVIFNFLIGNNDAHGKNFSMLREGEGTPRLAPLYDLVSTVSFNGLDRRMAMRIGGENRPEYVRRRHWEGFAEQINVSIRLVEETAQALVSNVREVRDEARALLDEGFADQAILDEINLQIDRRAGWLEEELLD